MNPVHTLIQVGQMPSLPYTKKMKPTHEQLLLWPIKDSKRKKRNLSEVSSKNGALLAWLFTNEAKNKILIVDC